VCGAAAPQGTPDTACGEERCGTWTCQSDGNTTCTGDVSRNACNVCGGAPTTGRPGDACGSCGGGVWACAETGGDTECVGDPVAVGEEPGAPYGQCGAWVCNDGGDTYGSDPYNPYACFDSQVQCGAVDDGCGASLECGTCNIFSSACANNQCDCDRTDTAYAPGENSAIAPSGLVATVDQFDGLALVITDPNNPNSLVWIGLENGCDQGIAWFPDSSAVAVLCGTGEVLVYNLFGQIALVGNASSGGFTHIAYTLSDAGAPAMRVGSFCQEMETVVLRATRIIDNIFRDQ